MEIRFCGYGIEEKEFLEKYHQIEKEIERIFADPHNKKIAILSQRGCDNDGQYDRSRETQESKLYF